MKWNDAKRFFFYGRDINIHAFIQVFIEVPLYASHSSICSNIVLFLGEHKTGMPSRSGKLGTQIPQNKKSLGNCTINYLIIVGYVPSKVEIEKLDSVIQDTCWSRGKSRLSRA